MRTDAGDLLHALRTTGGARRFTDDPVSDDRIHAVLDHARFAPSGGNRQGWRVIVVRDQAIRASLGALYRAPWDAYVRKWYPADPDPEVRRRLEQGNAFAASFGNVPVLLLVLLDLGTVSATDSALDRIPVVPGASVYPFVQNILLASRALGLGARITTLLSAREPEVFDLLSVPAGYALAAVVAVGYVERFPSSLSRRPVESFATVDRFDGPPLRN